MSGLDVRMLTVGPIQENAYIVSAAGSRRAVIVDPGDEAERLLAAARELGVEIEAILVTHCHFDHIGAVAEVARATGAPVYCPEIERGVLADIPSWTPPGFGPFESYEADHTVAGGERLSLAGLDIEVLFTPGHSPGHVTYAISAAGRGLRRMGPGRRSGCCSPATCSSRARSAASTCRAATGTCWSARSARCVRAFPAQTAVYPGHMGTTTLGRELDTNPFLAELRVPVERPAPGAAPEPAALQSPDPAAGR